MKKKLSRILAAVSAVLMLGTIATSCNGKKIDTSSSAVEEQKYDFNGMKITFADTWGKDLTPGKDEATDRLIAKIDEVEKKYNIEFEWIKVDSGPYWDNMASVIMSGEPFGDIMYSFPWMITDWIKAGAVKDAGAIAKSVGIDFYDGTWNEFIVSETTYKDTVFGFSKKQNNIQSGLLYNKRLFKEAKLTDPNELIKSGKKWDFATMEEYAKTLTKLDAGGNTIQWGLSTMDAHWLMTTFMVANGGEPVDYTQTPPKFNMDSPKNLAGLELFNKMLNTDKTIYLRPAGGDWKVTVDAFANGKVGMMRAEEWVIEYIRDVMTENGTNEDYGLTYFPMGPDAKEYVDESYGGNSYFIPASISNEKAQAALLVYRDLLDPSDDGYTKEERYRNTAEALFPDEASCDVYVDLMLNNKIKSNGVCRVGLREPMMELVGQFMDNLGTPQSIIAANKPAFQGYIDDSAYTQVVQGE
jgi:ABC-type glycerol-3-phosphate transport system substrate-binding protein